MPRRVRRRATTSAQGATSERGAPVGRLIDVGARRLFCRVVGEGAPSVVFLPGAGAMGLDFFSLQERAATRARTLVYDRAGTGWSDDVALPRPLGEVADELRTLLAAAGLSSPYLLVGHSLGGAIARHFAQRFPTEVCGLVLVDPAHEDGPAHYPPEVRAMSDAADAAPLPELPAELLEVWHQALESKYARFPAHVREPLVAQHLARARTGLEEGRDVERLVYAPLRGAGPTPDVPLVVLTAMGTEQSPTQFLPVALQRALNDGKRLVHLALAASVPRGEERSLPNAVHTWVCLEHEDEVLRAIDDVSGRRQ